MPCQARLTGHIMFSTCPLVWSSIHSFICYQVWERYLEHKWTGCYNNWHKICSDWHSTGSTRPDCNWTTKFQSTNQPHLPPSLRSPNLSESTFNWALKTHLLSTACRHWDVFMILVPDINIQTYSLSRHGATASNFGVRRSQI